MTKRLSTSPDRYVRAGKVFGAPVAEGNAVLLSLREDQYYGLNPTAHCIWRALEKPATLDQLVDAVRAEFAIDGDRCRRDIEPLLDEMIRMGLVERDGSPSDGPA